MLDDIQLDISKLYVDLYLTTNHNLKRTRWPQNILSYKLMAILK